MSDPRRTAKPRQLRGKISAGTADIDAFKSCIHDFMQENNFELTFEDVKQRGDYGPLHDYLFGLTESPWNVLITTWVLYFLTPATVSPSQIPSSAVTLKRAPED